ncbi:MAG: 2-hydroxyacyl-CoA dehydratase [Candidatus Cloacimonetes bacterium]|nr:2-hydroxyacyl-CoA dehydratase [Candidatus Cloacimonadota bacterium]
MKKIGFTTSFPIEPFLAAGFQVTDLNNVFISGRSNELVQSAEFQGYPRNICAWIKGMYALIKESDYDYILGVIQGDCSNTHSLLSTLEDSGQKILYFSFPYDRDRGALNNEIAKLEKFCGVSRDETQKMKQELDRVRAKLVKLDNLTWQTCQVSGEENHSWLVAASDFNGDHILLEDQLDNFFISIEDRPHNKNGLRLGYLGVPPIISDLYEFLESRNAHVVFNEIQRQFAMPYLENDIIEQYWKYTYPYSVKERLTDILEQIKIRKLQGLISYTQSFCHRQIDNLLIRKYAGIPVLTLEGDNPGVLDERTKLRLESFIDMLTL